MLLILSHGISFEENLIDNVGLEPASTVISQQPHKKINASPRIRASRRINASQGINAS